MPEKIDAAKKVLVQVEADLSTLLAIRPGAPYPFATVLRMLRNVRQGNFYLAQLTGGAAAALQRRFNLAVERVRGFGSTSLREFLFARWSSIQQEGEDGSSFPRPTWAQRVKELNEHQEVLDSEFVSAADSETLLIDWSTAFTRIEAVWKDKVVA